MSESSQSEDSDFDAQKLAEERDRSSLSSNPILLGKYVGSVLVFGFAIAVIFPRILPVQFPAFGVLTLGAVTGFGFVNERSLPLLKRLASTFGFFLSAYVGMWIFPIFLPFRMRMGVFSIVLILSAVIGGFLWYYIRNEILPDIFE